MPPRTESAPSSPSRRVDARVAVERVGDRARAAEQRVAVAAAVECVGAAPRRRLCRPRPPRTGCRRRRRRPASRRPTRRAASCPPASRGQRVPGAEPIAFSTPERCRCPRRWRCLGVRLAIHGAWPSPSSRRCRCRPRPSSRVVAGCCRTIESSTVLPLIDVVSRRQRDRRHRCPVTASRSSSPWPPSIVTPPIEIRGYSVETTGSSSTVSAPPPRRDRDRRDRLRMAVEPAADRVRRSCPDPAPIVERPPCRLPCRSGSSIVRIRRRRQRQLPRERVVAESSPP